MQRKREERREEEKEGDMSEEGRKREDDSAWGNKHHLLSGSLTARSRQVENRRGRAEHWVRVHVCVCVYFFVYACRGAASFQLREGHLSVSARTVACGSCPCVCLRGVPLDAIPFQCLTTYPEYHRASVRPSVILMLSVNLPVCPCVCPSLKQSSMSPLQWAHFASICPPACLFDAPVAMPLSCHSAYHHRFSVYPLHMPPRSASVNLIWWQIYWDQSSAVAAGSALFPGPTSQLLSSWQWPSKHVRCQLVHV